MINTAPARPVELDTGEQEVVARAFGARYAQLADARSFVRAHDVPEAETAITAEMDAVMYLWRTIAPDRGGVPFVLLEVSPEAEHERA